MAASIDKTKFETRIPHSLWEEYQEWRKAHGRPNNEEIGEALFRLFLSVPGWLQVLCRHGEEGQRMIRDTFAEMDLRVSLSTSADDEDALAQAAVAAARSGEAKPPEKKDAAAAKAG
jgi:hypothetical protein